MSDVTNDVEVQAVNLEALETVEQVDEAITALRERRKELKAEATKVKREAAKAEKARLMEEAKQRLVEAELTEGETVRAILKGEETVGEFVKQTEARFVILVNGEKKTLPFDKFLGVTE